MIHNRVFHGPGSTSEDDEAGKFAIFLRDARRQIAAEAVTQHEDALGVHFRLRAQQGRALDGIFHGFVLDREARQPGHGGAILPGPFFIAQNHHAAGRQAFGQILEHFGSADGFVPVVGSGAVHQHDGWEGSLPDGHGEGTREFPLTFADGHVTFAEGVRLNVGGPLPRRFTGKEEHSGH